MNRAKDKMVAICHWGCGVEVDSRTNRARTPLEGIIPEGSVGWVVCGPLCPSRPDGAVCFEQKPSVRPGLLRRGRGRV